MYNVTSTFASLTRVDSALPRLRRPPDGSTVRPMQSLISLISFIHCQDGCRFDVGVVSVGKKPQLFYTNVSFIVLISFVIYLLPCCEWFKCFKMSGEREIPAEDSIKVVCRFRPLNDSEEKAGSKFIVKFPSGGEDNCISIAVSPRCRKWRGFRQKCRSDLFYRRLTSFRLLELRSRSTDSTLIRPCFHLQGRAKSPSRSREFRFSALTGSAEGYF